MKKFLIIIAALVVAFIILILLMGITKGEVKEITLLTIPKMMEIKNHLFFILDQEIVLIVLNMVEHYKE
jgi:hypothetical protein